MSWSFQIGRLFGIPLRIHVTFFLLLGFIGWHEAETGQSLTAGLVGAGYIAALFLCVVLHELGHSLVARRYGVVVSHILLLPIGGVAMMERIPDNPRQELNIAVAGPLVSVFLAAVLGLAVVVTGGTLLPPVSRQLIGEGHFVARLAGINVFLAAFNLLPAFPMDGGRVLRALLAQRMDYARATHAAATVGQTMAFILGLIGIASGNIMLVLVATFVYLGAGQEEQHVQVRSLLRSVPVGNAMASRFAVMTPEETVGRAVEEANASYQQDFPVVGEGDALTGLVTRNLLISALWERGEQTPLQEVMETDFCRAEASDSLADLFDRMNRDACPVVVVVEGERPVGLLTPERVVQYLRFLSQHPYQRGT